VEDPNYVTGSTIENDRQWALARAAMIMRKKADAGAKPAAEEEAEVSAPGEPAEKEADQVADQVSDKLHGGAAPNGAEAKDKEGQEENRAEAERAPAEPAPEIGAELDGVGLKVYRAPNDKNEAQKKRGDHVFNNGVKQAGADLTRAMAGLPAKSRARPILTEAIAAFQANLSTDALEMTVDKPASAPGGDANSKAFGEAKLAFVGAFSDFILTYTRWEQAEGKRELELKMVTTASQALKVALSKMIKAAYDPETETYLSKDQKAKVAVGQAALEAARSGFEAAIHKVAI
jgi:hypothetical protein